MQVEPLQFEGDQIGQTTSGGSLAHTVIERDHNVGIQDSHDMNLLMF